MQKLEKKHVYAFEKRKNKNHKVLKSNWVLFHSNDDDNFICAKNPPARNHQLANRRCCPLESVSDCQLAVAVAGANAAAGSFAVHRH